MNVKQNHFASCCSFSEIPFLLFHRVFRFRCADGQILVWSAYAVCQSSQYRQLMNTSIFVLLAIHSWTVSIGAHNESLVILVWRSHWIGISSDPDRRFHAPWPRYISDPISYLGVTNFAKNADLLLCNQCLPSLFWSKKMEEKWQRIQAIGQYRCFFFGGSNSHGYLCKEKRCWFTQNHPLLQFGFLSRWHILEDSDEQIFQTSIYITPWHSILVFQLKKFLTWTDKFSFPNIQWISAAHVKTNLN